MSISIRPILADELETLTPTLVDLMSQVINAGASLGFLTPLVHDDVTHYWLSLRPELESGSCVALAAFDGDQLIGSGQIKFAPWPNAQHRAEIQKLFVANTVRRQGVGRLLMLALHDCAREHGRSLILLQTRRLGPTPNFYRSLGYKEIGVIPRYALTPEGERVDNLALYQELSA